MHRNLLLKIEIEFQPVQLHGVALLDAGLLELIDQLKKVLQSRRLYGNIEALSGKNSATKGKYGMKTYGIVLIGCGHIGLAHLTDIYYRDNVRIVACVDTNLSAAREAARRFGALAFGPDYRPFLERADVDICIIATYTASHLPIMQDCFAHGKHVLCEKPIAGSLEEGEAFVRAVKASKQKCLVAHILRHNDSYRKINFNGTSGDVDVLTHEAGHAFAFYESRNQPLAEYLSPTSEACEVHSMSMEFFCWKYLDYFYGGQTKKAKLQHLTDALIFLPYGTMVDRSSRRRTGWG